MSLDAVVYSIAGFVALHAGVAIFWAGKHDERSRAHGVAVAALQEQQQNWRDAVRAEVKSALDDWQKSRGEKMGELGEELEKLDLKLDKVVGEIQGIVSGFMARLTDQAFQIREIQQRLKIAPPPPTGLPRAGGE